MNPLDLTGKTVMVTGASNGIGRSTSVYLESAGSKNCRGRSKPGAAR